MKHGTTSPLPPELTELYDVLEVLGEGGMAVVYRAHQKALRRVVALKVMHGAGPGDDDRPLERFLREARTASRLHHPNVVTVYDVGMSAAMPYIAMEYVEGATYSDLIHNGLPLRQALSLLVGVTAGLAHAHDLDIVHRDLKPANILVTREGTAKVADWGLAKPLDDDVTRLTLTGGQVGTPLYMAPEQAEGRPVTAAADLYTLGIIIYRTALIAGGLEHSPAMEALGRHQTCDVPPLHAALPSTDRRLSDLTTRLMARHERRRPPSAAAVGTELAAIVAGKDEVTADDTAGLTAITPRRPPTTGHGTSPKAAADGPPSSWRRALVVVCVLAVPGLLALLAWVHRGDGAAPDLELVRCALSDFDALTLVYRGPVSMRRRLVLRGLDGEPAAGRLPLVLDLSRGDEASPRIYRLVVPLDPPVTTPLLATVEPPEGSPDGAAPPCFPISPAPLRTALLAPLNRLDEDGLRLLLGRVHAACTTGATTALPHEQTA